ncbi:hypothetical protein Dimus_019535 [Dionaea muscipula]
MVKGTTSLGSSVKKRVSLSDITNSQSYRISPAKGEISPPGIDSATKVYTDQLLKENLTLLKHLQEKNKLAEQRGAELRNLRASLQRIQLQNWQLAQTNTHILADLNLGKEKLRALEHELACKNTLLKAKSMKLQETPAEFECAERTDGKLQLQPDNDKKKTRDSNQRRDAIMGGGGGGSTATAAAETVKRKKMGENKRCCLRRRHSLKANVKSHGIILENDLFEIDVANFPLCRNHSMDPTKAAKSSSGLSDSRTDNATDHSSTSVAVNGRRRSSVELKGLYLGREAL